MKFIAGAFIITLGVIGCEVGSYTPAPTRDPIKTEVKISTREKENKEKREETKKLIELNDLYNLIYAHASSYDGKPGLSPKDLVVQSKIHDA